MRRARGLGVPVWSEVELGYRLLSGVELVAVTGTNGKTTTSELLGVMLGAPVARATWAAPLCELDGRVAAGERVVCEVSSFQLEDIHEFRPRAAVLLNLEPDHLDRHGTLEAYREAKLRVFENQEPDDAAVVPRGFGPSRDATATGVRRRRPPARRAADTGRAQPRERRRGDRGRARAARARRRRRSPPP